MFRLRTLIAWTSVAVLCSLAVFSAASQVDSIKRATDVPFQEWQAVLHAPEGRVDRQVKVVDIGNSHVAVGVLFRDPIVATDDPVRGIVHTRVSEVYYITSGSGVLVTGGTHLSRSDIPASSDIVTELVGESFSTSLAGDDS